MTYANHLLAEVEQIAHQDKKRREKEEKPGDLRMKRLEEAAKGDGKGAKGDDGHTCRFFLSEGGCKKGKSCGWKHVLDDQRRCWTCGSVKHYAPDCDRPREPDAGGGEKGGKVGHGKGAPTGYAKAAKREEAKKEEIGKKEEGEEENPAETMKNLLEEANKMLKGMKGHDDEKKGKDEKLAAMQAQLDELRKLKVLRLSRIEHRESRYGLLDSGATHPMRGREAGEDIEQYEKVKVTLADGRQAEMRMTQNGVMVIDEEGVEPIVPMSAVAGVLGYTVVWSQGKMKLTHPDHGEIKVKMVGGCPQIAKRTALRLIRELEEDKKIKVARKEVEEVDWLRGLVDAHPVLRGLPDHIKDNLVAEPAPDLKKLPECNRRRRKLMAEKGFVVHLYAGDREGYTMTRAMKECGGDVRRLLEIDVLRQGETTGSHDMLTRDGPYASLLRAALDGSLKGIIMGPNCRTRSVLRHYPLPIPGGGPRPVRSWEEPWGMQRNTEEERKKVEEDDYLLWRGLMLYVVHEEVRKAMKLPEDQRAFLGIEQPADPKRYKPEVVSFWRTMEWMKLSVSYQLQEQSFLQSKWGGKAKKPTTFAGNLRLRLPPSTGEEDEEQTGDDKVESSKELARWAPGFMKEVASQIQGQIFRMPVRQAKMSWEEHVQRGHTPFRRDCQVCQEASAISRRHLAKSHPRAGVMSVDLAGPFARGHDVEMEAKFMLVGTYTWLLPEDATEDEEPEDEAEGLEEVPGLEDPGGLPEEEEGLEGAEDVSEAEEPDEPEGGAEVDGERREPHVQVIHVGVPLKGKSKEDVLGGMIEIYLQLRVDGFPVHTIHTDRGREFTNQRARNWMRSRMIVHSTNGGEDPRANGRAERAVGLIKGKVRRVLHASGMEVKWWPMALRYLMESERIRRRDEERRIPQFGQTILVKKRIWRTKALEPTHEACRYLSPLLESHGHCVLREDGRWGVVPYVVKNIRSPPPPTEEMWLAVSEEVDRDEHEERRRIREKTPVRDGGRVRLKSIKMMLKEESEHLEEDTVENATLGFKKMEPWRRMLKKAETGDEEILQTKIIGVQEMLGELDLWDSAIRSEIRSLFEEKEALQRITKAEMEEMRSRKPDTPILPAKLVITRKAGGRRKIRIVVCGNYAAKAENEELYAGGSDTISLRVGLQRAASSGWHGATCDIKTAFLNAPLPAVDANGEENVVLIAPPRILIRLGYAKEGEYWTAIRAMYGLRQSPRAWGLHRDLMFEEMEWEADEKLMVFKAADTDPNVWKLVEAEEGITPETRGLMLVYVDDLLILGEKALVQATLQRVAKKWEISTPEWLGGLKPVRFLGLDIWRTEEGIFINQECYIRDVLKRNGDEDVMRSGVPITKDQAQRLDEEDPEKTAEDVRLAQKATGEIMWLGTKSRPDLMYTLSRMSMATLRNPKEVVRVGQQVRKYLQKTIGEGLWFRRDRGGDLVVYSDSSYGPGGMDSQGTVVVQWCGGMMMWKSGRQAVPSLSTAESELQEAIEGLVMGDSVDVLIQEVAEKAYSRTVKVDNHAAISLLVDPSGSWRTRHLRLRAAHLRWRLQRAD